MRVSTVTPALCLTLASCTGADSGRVPGVVDDARLVGAGANPDNWLTCGRTYAEQRFSPLSQISEATVNRLGLSWYADVLSSRLDRGPESWTGPGLVSGGEDIAVPVRKRCRNLPG